MTDDTAAPIIPLHHPQPKRAKAPAERAKSYRQRTKAKVRSLPVAAQVSTTLSESDMVTPITPAPPPTVALCAVTPSRPRVAPILLTASALALAGVGMTMNAGLRGRLDRAISPDGFSSPLAWLPI